MARLTFPDEGSRLVYRSTSNGRALNSAAGAAVIVYIDAAATQAANITTVDGTAITGGALNVDAYSRLPLFKGPNDGTDTLYVVIDGGPPVPVYARNDDRLDALLAQVNALTASTGSADTAEATARAAADAAETAARIAADAADTVDDATEATARANADTAEIAARAAAVAAEAAARATAVGDEVTARAAAVTAEANARIAADAAMNTTVTANTTAIGIRQIAVDHGSTAGTARPTSTLPVKWFGTVAPTNAVTNDEWYDRSIDLLKRYDGTAWQAVGKSTYAIARDAPSVLGSAGMTRSVTSAGKMVCGFGTGLWAPTAGGAAPLTQGYTGYDANGNRTGIVSRTGQTEMLAWTPVSDAGQAIQLQSAGTNLLTTALNGQIGLWVYVENQPGYQPGGSFQGNIGIYLTTNASVFTNSVYAGFNANQVREGWNFLKFVQRVPAAYVSGSGVSEDHPFGVACTGFGTGADTNIVANPITGIRVEASNLGGATLYLDSMWTGLASQSQVVLGCDLQSTDLVTYALPLMAANGWVGYTAVPARIWPGSGSRLVSDLTPVLDRAVTLYAAGWDNINHTMNHLPGTASTPNMGELTSASEIAYEVGGVEALYLSRGMRRGSEFYASPQSRSSRLSEKVIREAGFLLQRHSRKMNTTVTGYGIDNPHHVGATDLGHATANGVATVTAGVAGSSAGSQVFSKIKRQIDVIEAYGDAWFPFWHNISTLGDSGSGEDLTGDNLVISYSAFQKTIAYLKAREDAGGLRVRDGFTGFYYGIGR